MSRKEQRRSRAYSAPHGGHAGFRPLPASLRMRIRPEYRFKAGVHFFLFDKLAALGGGPGFGGRLRKLRFLLRCEMYFHAYRVRQQQRNIAGMKSPTTRACLVMLGLAFALQA